MAWRSGGGWGVATAVVAIVVVAGWGTIRCERQGDGALEWDTAATEAYLARLDPERFARLGVSFTDARYEPRRFGDGANVYPLEYLEEKEAELAGVDRQRVLRAIFDRWTAGAATDTERHRAILDFLHRVGFHGRVLAGYPDGRRVADPLLLLELNEMRCGQISRLAVDLFGAAGYDARLVVFGNHTAAEIRYDGDWHVLDADSLGGGGLTPLAPDGTIPSVRELADHPEWIDALPHRFELRHDGGPRLEGSPVRSWGYFSRDTDEIRGYWTKSGPGLPGDRFYGWVEPDTHPADFPLVPGPRRTQPGAPALRSVRVRADDPEGPAAVTISWQASADDDGDLLGYRVLVGSSSRGWSYERFAGEEEARRFWSNDEGWRPEMYDRLYRRPPDDVALVETAETEVTLALPGRGTYYVTIMPFDAYHERAGKELYLMSNELKIHLPGPARG